MRYISWNYLRTLSSWAYVSETLHSCSRMLPTICSASSEMLNVREYSQLFANGFTRFAVNWASLYTRPVTQTHCYRYLLMHNSIINICAKSTINILDNLVLLVLNVVTYCITWKSTQFSAPTPSALWASSGVYSLEHAQKHVLASLHDYQHICFFIVCDEMYVCDDTLKQKLNGSLCMRVQAIGIQASRSWTISKVCRLTRNDTDFGLQTLWPETRPIRNTGSKYRIIPETTKKHKILRRFQMISSKRRI